MEQAILTAGTQARVATQRPLRSDSIDALRAAITLLVVLHHTAIAYGATGGWFHYEVVASDQFGSRLLTFFCTINQAFFMGLFFLLAGYYTPGALARKGPARFLKDRLIRLGIPLAVFGWIIGPVTIALAQTQRGRPFLATLVYLWKAGTFEPGPLWFCEALLIFSAAAALWWRLAPTTHSRPGEPPSNRALLLAAVLTGAVAFGLRFAWPVGTTWRALQLGYFASYVVLFVGGMDAARSKWIERPRQEQARLWRRVTWVALPVLPIVALSAPHVPVLQGPAEGGWSVLALVYAFWEPFVAWGLILALLAAFQYRIVPGPRWRALSDRAYTIFVIHPPVVVAVTIAMHGMALPPVIKFVIAGAVGCLACYWIAGMLLRLPGARRVL